MIPDDHFIRDFARSFNAALTNLIWIVLGVGLLYSVALFWWQQLILGVLGLLSILIVPIAWCAKRQIAQGHIRMSLGLIIGGIVFILSSALLLVRGLDVILVAGFSIPMVLIALLRAPRYSVGIAVFVGLLYAGARLLAPALPWQAVRLDPVVGIIVTTITTVSMLGILGLLSEQIVNLLQHALERAHMHLAAHQNAETALRESEARFRGAFDYAAIGMALIARDGCWLQVNRALCELVGYTESELLGITLQAITHPDDVDSDTVYTQQMLAGAIRTYQLEKRYVHKSGRVVWALLSVSMVNDAHDHPCYFIAQFQDITARKKAEIELSQSYANNYALLQALPDTLYRLGKDGTLRDYKAGLTDYITIPSALFLGRHITEVFPSAVADQLNRAMTDALTSGNIQLIEQEISIDETKRDYEFRVVSNGVDEILVLVRDISERKMSERLKDEFVATVSHELRTPLTAIHGALGLVGGGVAGTLSERARTMVDIALTNSERLIRLINDLLDIQTIEAGKVAVHRRPLALRPVLEQLITSNYAYGQKFGVTFRLEDESGDVVVNTDPDRLTQVLTNLLSNAAKFSTYGDIVIIQVSRQQELVRIAVTDHGPGIPAAFQPQLFQKFAQANGSNTRRTGGTGLGLSIAKTLIERLGGRIGFETAAGVGTTFYVELPEWLPEWQYEIEARVIAQTSARGNPVI